MSERIIPFSDSDKLVKARAPRSEIQMLVKLVEGLGHLGVVTTLDKVTGEVLFQATQDTWPDLRQAVEKMGLGVEFLKEER
ncbi:DUF4911 domain-containing protein [Desulfitobacterium metallireducens]|uniref:DUF4911 domain-containing protein n=1 Tax=Desulfitobacterium metallireducens DSM 15288 TaxID=871968 RepID=W0E9J3_9FIRM|nr:DUF4911 domain-containing protein [Desulfitobacterium metallireducens]AHF07437.1 hypothetical protein DESME_10665 [Desulfitobacterium metallireducens DSM 15288]